MGIENIGFVGVRTSKFQATVSLFRDCLDVPVILEKSSKIRFESHSGAIIELYNMEDEFHSFFKTGPVVGFTVSNFNISKKRMLMEGVKFIGKAQHADGVSWQHFHLPDGTIAEILGSQST